MYPILVTIGPVTLYNFSIFLILSWCVFSFFFWKSLRQYAVEEDKIFDLTFYATLVGLLFSRVMFVAFHWELFSDTWLKIIAIWVQPGLSLYGALFGALSTLIVMSKSLKVRLGIILDAFVQSFPFAGLIGSIGTFLDGTIVGAVSTLPWAMRSIGQVGLRHPVSVYHMIAYVLFILYIFWLSKRGMKLKYPYGLIGIIFFMTFSFCMFVVEFTRARQVYWLSLSVNQWVQVALFAESFGAFYVRGGGRERLRPFINKFSHIKTFISKFYGKQ